ncbi:hypothetical protein SAMN05428944_4440 [Streptomyces sp. 1222.5]|uniref:hypothetical protein n=1 Tax=unclassified Streptomyces TaxID=2593676 RepID=UPI00089C3A7E|nr:MULTISPECIES: hypothetical protein [unclassified Streptomyces]PKW08452.1 hypothetical protein BX260_3656 [Streptomyces sp. 5112.2]SEC62759.1 hypothetical protein SAMN05428944_4440 [Streptomyces sp. 1222.5]
MQRKAYLPGTAALLAVLLAGCTSGSGDESPTDDANPGDAGTATVTAQPGKYRSLPEPCGAIDHDGLDSLLPGIKQITDPSQRDKAYQGQATLTYDTNRKVGCGWKVESADATDRLSVDFERVVSYDNSVSDADQAKTLYQDKETAADLPEQSSGSATTQSPAGTPTPTASHSGGASPSDSPSTPASGASGSAAGAPPDDLQPRVLTDLGDQGYLDDRLKPSGSTAGQRTVTVVFRTSNVVVTIQYEEQPTATGTVPESKEMQDRALELASQLDDELGG